MILRFYDLRIERRISNPPMAEIKEILNTEERRKKVPNSNGGIVR